MVPFIRGASLTFLLTCAAHGTPRKVSAAFTAKLNQIPDLPQNDHVYGAIPHNGNYHCGPAAAANVIVWFDEHGCDQLVEGVTSTREQQCKLIAVLGSRSYCNTGEKRGTGAVALMSGIEKYVKEKHCPAARSGKGTRHERCLLVHTRIHDVSSPEGGAATGSLDRFELKGVVLKKGADCCLVDGAIAIAIDPRCQAK